MKPSKNLLMIQEVAKGLKELKDSVVFVGGAVTGLYIDDPGAPPVTASDDVDCVIEVAGLAEYTKFEMTLAKLGFKRPVDEEDSRIICRWVYRGILVDVMPAQGKILGFTNRWYPEAVQEKMTITLPNGTPVFVFSAPYFIATKLEALKNRGDDLRMSQDLEDIVSVLDGCTTIQTEMSSASDALKKYYKVEFRSILRDRDFLTEAVAGFLRSSGDYQARALRIIQFIERL